MKKMLQFALISSALLFTFSCSDNGTEVTSDPGSALTDTWMVTGMMAYDDVACSETSLFSYGSSAPSDNTGYINAETDADCQNLEWFVSAMGDDDATGADFEAGSFCDGTDNLNVSMYFVMTSSDSLDSEAAGNYTKTLYATSDNGQDHSKEYTTYGRYFTYGTNMVTQVLAKVVNDDGAGNDRFVKAEEDADDERDWTYAIASGGLNTTWVDPASAGDADGVASCVVLYFQETTDYALRGCTDETASNYMGGESNEFGLTATEETGHCVYTADEAAQACVKISHDDINGDGMYDDDEKITYAGIIDCAGACQYEAAAAWVGDGVCDGTDGNRGDGEYNCEAFNWDGWDCACATDCLSTYDADTGAAGSVDGDETSQVGQGNGGAGSGNYAVTNCQDACNVEECGYDISNIGDTSTWDCCPEACILSAGTATSCDEACNIGACDFYRNAATNTAANIGLCCAPGNDALGNAIDCAALAGDGSCDEACNTGACNNDGGDCE